ncbi:MAG: rod shape-determining protein RodA [Clostridiales bacterium]|nr:rod shape-determining protein RodA [Clostridiales bacterium]
MFDKKLVKNFDFLILFFIILLTGFGLVGIMLATRSPVEGPDGAVLEGLGSFNLQQVKLQAINFITGLVIMAIIISIDYHIISDLSVYYYWLIVGLLIIVKLFGTKGGGAQSWLAIGSFRMQPSEFSKIAVILMLARVMAKQEETGVNNLKTMAKLLLVVAIPFVFIAIQPDFGTASVLIVILVGMLFIAEFKYKYLFIALGIGLAAIPLAWFLYFDEYQKYRLIVFLNPGMDPLGDGYHVIQSITSLGSGQLTGQFGRGELLSGNSLSQLNFLPAKDTDFIYSVTTEALGFVGGISVILLFYMLLMRTMRIARRSRDVLGSYICVGVASMILFHVFENIGMSMGIMPITGIPLPFMSYGGSSMWTNMASFALVINVGMRRQKLKF